MKPLESKPIAFINDDDQSFLKKIEIVKIMWNRQIWFEIMIFYTPRNLV